MNTDYDALYEEEMMLLASEMSLVDNHPDLLNDLDDELDWNPDNLDETKENIRKLENIVNQHFTSERNDDQYGKPISDSQIKDLFSMNFTSNDDNSFKSFDDSSYHSYSGDATPQIASVVTKSNKKKNYVAASTKDKSLLNRRPSGRGREQKIIDTVQSISQKLRWYQNKIVQTIESTHNEENESLANLLELNDRVSNLYSKTEQLRHHGGNGVQQHHHHHSARDSESGLANAVGYIGRAGNADTALHNTFSTGDTTSFSYDSAGRMHFNDIAPTVYSLSRGSGRKETLFAVDKLIKLCNFGGEVRLEAVKQMMAAGALQSLLSTLARAGDWPEVELQISKVISILVTYEDDWALLQRSAYVILSSLYTLQLKTQARTRVTNDNNDNYRKAFGMHAGAGELELRLPSGFDEEEDEEEDEYDDNNSPRSSSSVKTRMDHSERHELARVSTLEDQTQDVRALVSAAIAKLTLVLSCEWGALKTPLSSSSGNNNHSQHPHSKFGTQSNGLGGAHDGGRNEFQRSNSVNNSQYEDGKGGRARVQSSTADSISNSDILEILLNLIVSMSEASLNSIHQQGVNNTTDKVNIDVAFNNAAERDQMGLETLEGYSIRMFSNSSHDNSSSSAVNGKSESVKSISFSPANHASSDAAANQPANELIAKHLNIPPLQIDNTTVLCSAALSNLAEIPQCRPGLVTGGALKIIKAWLEIGIEILKHARLMCDRCANPHNHSPPKNVSEVFAEFMMTYGTAYELLSNAASAIMFLSGGNDARFGQSGARSHPLREGNGGKDYIVGWIDAQILAEGIPSVLVKLITCAVEDFTLLSDKREISVTQTTRSVLPAAVGMHLSQTLYHLCSRQQNRQQLKLINIPFALCVLFENMVSQVRNITYCQKKQDLDSSPHQSNLCAHETIYDYIFDFNGCYYQQEVESTAAETPRASVSTFKGESGGRQPNTPVTVGGSITVLSNSRAGSIKVLSASGSVTPGGNGCKTPTLKNSLPGSVGGATNRPPQQQNNEESLHNKKSNVMLLMSSVTSSCLDALTYFFSDELNKQSSSGNNHLNCGINALSVSIAPRFGNGGNPSQKSFPSGAQQQMSVLVDLMCHIRIIDAVLLASSYLPRGQGRLATMRLISNLTEFPQSLKALYDNSVVDVLVLISSEAEEVKVSTNFGCSFKENEENYNSGSTVAHLARPLNAQRDTSHSSTTVSALSATSVHRKKNVLGVNSQHGRSGVASPRPRGNDSSSDDEDSDDENAEAANMSNIATEETLIVCYSLANLCAADMVYATRMFNSGLFMIMIKLVCSSHMEISRQALRCMSAMCPVISNESINKAIFLNKRLKNTLFFEALAALSVALKSPSILVQKGAVNTIAHLALINEQIQDSVVEGPLRSIISLLVNPKNDRETRNAAEDVLKNVGFLSGVKDFELCGYDFEILRDWYAMKRSLKPQDMALDILKEWIENLFSDADVSTNELFNLHHKHNNAELSAHGLANAAVTILQTGSSNSSILQNTAISGSNAQSIAHVNNQGHCLPAGTSGPIFHSNSYDNHKPAKEHMIAMPHLQRNFTDGLMKFLPFCLPKVSGMSRSKHDSHSSHGISRHGKQDPYSSHGGTNHGDMTISNDRSGHGKDDDHHNGANNKSGGDLDHLNIPSSNVMNRSTVPLPVLNNANSLSSPTHLGNSSPYDDSYDWLDRPPMGVSHLYDLFYSSKLHQSLFMDITSIGVTSGGDNGDTEDDRSRSVNTASELEMSDFEVYLMPRPLEVSAILLPSRLYQTFARVGRVLEKMIEYSGTAASPTYGQPVTEKMWSLTFRESEFLGDFHTTLLSTLRKCPQICSLSFDSSHVMEDDALLGHLVGQIPSSVRFLSFKSTLSKQSIQALCILIRTQNAAFTASYEVAQELLSRGERGGLRKASGNAPTSINISNNKMTGHTRHPKTPQSGVGTSRAYTKGLVGLALTHFAFDDSALNHIVELLQLNTKTSVQQRAKSFYKNHGFRKSGSETPTTPSMRQDVMKGLRFIDLSYNSLNDTQCARILQAAITGPLEGLDLCGNSIYRGKSFVEVMQNFLPEKMTQQRIRLRWLGLAANNLHNKAVNGVLTALLENDTVTHLDLSSNDIDHSVSTNELLRTFLICNEGLRSFNLCYNKLGMESFREIHLGLLENDNVLLLPLAGNPQVDKSGTISLIQIKLKENRLLYKARCKAPETVTMRASGISVGNESEERLSFGNTIRANIPQAAEANYARLSDPDIQIANAVPIGLVPPNDASSPFPNTPFTPEDDSDIGVTPVVSRPMNVKVGAQPALHLMDPKNVLAESTSPHTLYHSPDLFPRPSSAVAVAVLLKDHASISPAIPIVGGRSHRFAESSTKSNDGSSPSVPRVEAIVTDVDNSTRISISDGATSNVVGLFEKNVQIHNEQSAVDSSKPASIVSDTSTITNTLHVLFSAPLAGFDRNSKAHPLEVLDYTAERDILIQVFKEVHRDVSVHFDFATTDSLRTALSFGCKALHFSGHGIPKGLCFEDGRSGLQVIRVPQLKDLLGAGGLQLQFVFVSACFSKEIGEAFVKAGVPHVVCVKVDSKIQDAAAIAFTRAFYVAFISGRTVKDSFNIAKEALKVSPYVPDSVLEGEKFILLPDGTEAIDATNPLAPRLDEFGVLVDHTGAPVDRPQHEKCIFMNRNISKWPLPGQCTTGPNYTDVTIAEARNKIPAPPADFEGREVIMHSLISSILERRLVSLVGEDGVGKTSVASAVCKYITDRKIFSDGVIFFKAKGLKDYKSFLKGLMHTLLLSEKETVKKLEALMQKQAQQKSYSTLIYPEEELIFQCLEHSKMVLVIDNLDDLLSDYGESITDLRLFLGRLFDQCPHLKVLVVSVDTLSMHNINVGFGIVEYSVLLGPLTLNSTLRLFAKLAPSLTTAKAKNDFIHALQPAKQLHVSVNSRDINNTALQILALFGDGHPSKIVHLACESTAESVERLKATGTKIIRESLPGYHMNQQGGSGLEA